MNEEPPYCMYCNFSLSQGTHCPFVSCEMCVEGPCDYWCCWGMVIPGKAMQTPDGREFVAVAGDVTTPRTPQLLHPVQQVVKRVEWRTLLPRA